LWTIAVYIPMPFMINIYACTPRDGWMIDRWEKDRERKREIQMYVTQIKKGKEIGIACILNM
jgi:hypothetical protein